LSKIQGVVKGEEEEEEEREREKEREREREVGTCKSKKITNPWY